MKAFVFTLMVTAASAAAAQTAADLSGHWKGTIDIPNSPSDFELDVARNARGELVGTAAAGAERVTVPLQTLKVVGTQVTFFARSDQPFRGEISAGGTSVAGSAMLGGYELPFSMTRTGDAKISPPPTGPAVSKELEGVWKAELPANGRQYHFLVTITNRPDGRAEATSVSVDEGGLILNLRIAQEGAKVTFDSPHLLSYSGALNAAGTEIAGTFTQGALSVPLTFTR